MTTPTSSGPAGPPTSRSRWPRRLAIGAAGLVVLFLLRAQILTLLASPLVRDEPLLRGDTVVILGGDDSNEVAARLLLENWTGSGRILVATTPPDEWSAAGILPDEMSLTRAKLERLGVPPDQIHEIRLRGVDNSLSHELATWLGKHPEAKCVVLCEEMQSRETRWRLDRTLAPADRERVALQALRHRKYCRSDWWKCEEGISAFVGGWISLILQSTRGDVIEEWRECQPTQFTMSR